MKLIFINCLSLGEMHVLLSIRIQKFTVIKENLHEYEKNNKNNKKLKNEVCNGRPISNFHLGPS